MKTPKSKFKAYCDEIIQNSLILQLGRCSKFLIKVCQEEIPKIDFFKEADIEPRNIDIDEFDHQFNIMIREVY
jgi:hypothetical protein